MSFYPREIRDNIDNANLCLPAHVVSVMTIFQAMGDALINAHKLSGLKPRGPRLLMDCEYESQLFDIGVSILDRYSDHLGIDWIHSEVDLVNDILQKIGVDTLSTTEIESLLRAYVNRHKAVLPIGWKQSVEYLISGTVA